MFLQLFIDGEFRDSASKNKFTVINPATEEAICEVSHAHKEDVDAAVAAAKRAFPAWSSMDPLQRAGILYKMADLIEKYKEDLGTTSTHVAQRKFLTHQKILCRCPGRLEALNNGKSIEAARDYDVMQAATIFRYYAGWVDKLPLGEVVPSDNGHQVIVSRQACGIVGAIVPWNFPIMLTTWKVAPALAVGCCVVLKPSEVTPLTGLFLGKIAQEAGLPAGVLNIVPGLGQTAGEAITSHQEIDKVPQNRKSDQPLVF